MEEMRKIYQPSKLNDKKIKIENSQIEPSKIKYFLTPNHS